jgi:predicted choloylglycine hydrolase
MFAISEQKPAEKWRQRFSASWPRYRDWYLREGLEARPTRDEARTAIGRHMPELLPLYDKVCSLVGDDPIAQRALSLYRTPPVISGCSVALAPGDEPVLVRNYDFNPDFFEGTVVHSRWLERQVIATSEAWIGCLDGLNGAGLAVALTFGGRIVHAEEGFQTPLLLRYVLETCDTTEQAVVRLQRLPVQMANNVMVLDRNGDYAVVYLSPDRQAVVRKTPVTTNHQLSLEWPEGNAWSETAERSECLLRLRADGPELKTFIEAFHRKPLYRTAYDEGLGTLYTAVIRPVSGTIEYHWPRQPLWKQSLDEFSEGAREVTTD